MVTIRNIGLFENEKGEQHQLKGAVKKTSRKIGGEFPRSREYGLDPEGHDKKC